MGPDLQQLLQRIVSFRDERDWKQFHSLKNLTCALAVEAAELMEPTQWKSAEELERSLADPILKASFAGEIADVFIYLLLVCEKLGVDPIEAANQKLLENAKRYPADKARGSSKKYTEL